jgi:hypothetical protein
MKARNLSLVSLVIFIVSCGINFPPNPPPTPPPTPIPTPIPECLPNLPWCNEMNPPQTCGECKHNPTNDPNYCEKADPCPPVDPCENVHCDPGFHCDKGTCVKNPPPPDNGFPVRFPLDTTIVYMRNSRWNAGIDSTIRINGDQALCEALHHVSVGDCHFDSDVWTYEGQRAQYEMMVMAGARAGNNITNKLCAVWRYKSGAKVDRCHNDTKVALVSCDHFGDTVHRDDPKTDPFEGEPFECGEQKDEFGPYAGFFTIPNCTPGSECLVRACLPLEEGNEATCAPWINVTWRNVASKVKKVKR